MLIYIKSLLLLFGFMNILIVKLFSLHALILLGFRFSNRIERKLVILYEFARIFWGDLYRIIKPKLRTNYRRIIQCNIVHFTSSFPQHVLVFVIVRFSCGLALYNSDIAEFRVDIGQYNLFKNWFQSDFYFLYRCNGDSFWCRLELYVLEGSELGHARIQ